MKNQIVIINIAEYLKKNSYEQYYRVLKDAWRM